MPVDPAREDGLAERGQVLVAAALQQTSAPLALRERIEAQRTRTAPARRRRRAALGALAAGGAALALAIVLLVAPGGAPGSPSLSQAAALGARAAQQSAPGRDAANRHLLLISEGGIRFPAWNVLAWPACGVRRDRLGGRDTTTVFYRTPAGAPIAYTIVDGPPLHGTDAKRVRTIRSGSRTAVVWQRAGHTCILTAPASFPVDQLTALTDWR
jgi:hypothetical protein